MSAGPADYDVAVVGAGILGLAVARELTNRRPGLRIVVLERHAEVATEQTGRNSGVVHAGIYYAPGSLKARLCVEGARELYEYCDEQGVRYERCGKVIVARDPAELPALDELARRGRANGVPGLRRLTAEELREIEPHARGAAALHSPATGIVDFGQVAAAMAAELRARGVEIATGREVADVEHRSGAIVLRHASSESPAPTPDGEIHARFAVFCAGLAASRLAALAGISPDPRIVPFRGSYLYLRPERRHLVRGLIYPVPDAALPFLGVHLSRHLDGQVSLGPTALLWPRRPGDVLWPGTVRVARRWWRTGLREIRHALSRRAFAATAAEYVPELEPGDFRAGFSGIRAQAVARDGRLVDDFVVSNAERALHVRNAPSPAATSSLVLARLIADRAEPALV